VKFGKGERCISSGALTFFVLQSSTTELFLKRPCQKDPQLVAKSKILVHMYHTCSCSMYGNVGGEEEKEKE